MRILAALLMIGLASAARAENHEENKAPLDWDDYIVCKGYDFTAFGDYGQYDLDTDNLTIPKVLKFMKQFAESYSGMPERNYASFVNVFFKKNDNDTIIVEYDDPEYENDLYYFKISDRSEPKFYVMRTEEAIARLTFDKVNEDPIDPFRYKSEKVNQYDFAMAYKKISIQNGDDPFSEELYISYGSIRCPEKLSLGQK